MRIVFENPWVRAGGLLAALVLACLLAYLLSSVLIPLFFAFIVAYAFDPLIDIFQKYRVRRMVAILSLLLFLFGAALSVPLFVLPGLVTEGERLISRATTGLQDQWIDRVLERLPVNLLVDQLEAMNDQAVEETAQPLTEEEAIIRKHLRSQSAMEKAGITTAADGATGTPTAAEAEQNVRERLLRELGELIKNNAAKFVASNVREILGAGQTVGSTAAGFLGSLLGLLVAGAVFAGNVALFVFVTIYLLNDYDHIIAVCDDLVPHRLRPRVRSVMGRIDQQLRAFFRGQGLVCLCLGTMYGIGFWLSDVPFGIPLAIFGGLVSFVPYLGLALTIGPAVVLTMLVHGVDGHVLGVIITFAVAQALEGNLITPAIVGKQVGLGPVWVILAIMVFGGAMGFTGLLIAVPVAAVLKVLIEELVDAYRASAFFGAPEPPPSAGAPPA